MSKTIDRLTICIPTFNRKTELRQALESIEKELGASAHVVVSDNASTDATETMCETFGRRNVLKSFRYCRADQNYGPDWNYLKAVSLADTDYRMILGSDDALMPGAAELLREVIESEVDIAIFSRALFDRKFEQMRGVQTFWKSNAPSTIDMSQPRELAAYIRSCKSLAGVFSYLSCFVFKQSVWCETERVHQFIGSAYSHVAALLEGITRRKKTMLRVSRDPLVKCRLGNDSFLDEGALRRFEIDWDGYEALERMFYPNMQGVLTDILSRSNAWKDLVALRYRLGENRDGTAIKKVTTRFRNAPWGAQPLFRWRIARAMPMGVLRVAHDVLKQ